MSTYLRAWPNRLMRLQLGWVPGEIDIDRVPSVCRFNPLQATSVAMTSSISPFFTLSLIRLRSTAAYCVPLWTRLFHRFSQHKNHPHMAIIKFSYNKLTVSINNRPERI